MYADGGKGGGVTAVCGVGLPERVISSIITIFASLTDAASIAIHERRRGRRGPC